MGTYIGFDVDTLHVVELEVDAHGVEIGAILSFVAHLVTWVCFARNNICIHFDKIEA